METLAERAAEAKCAQKLYVAADTKEVTAAIPTGRLTSRYRKAGASDQKKQIQGWKALRRVPGVTAMQMTKINAAAASGRAAVRQWLSPRQRTALRKLEGSPAGVGTEE